MKAAITDITELRVDAVVNAANGRGPMGSGVAGALRRAGGKKVQDDATKVCKAAGGYKEGDCYISDSGDLSDHGVKAIYHAVTMELPGGRSSLDAVGNAMRKVLELAVQNGIKTIAFPGLGTGVGALNSKSVANLMVRIARKYSDKIEISFADIDPTFIGHVQQIIQAGECNNEKEHTGQNGHGAQQKLGAGPHKVGS